MYLRQDSILLRSLSSIISRIKNSYPDRILLRVSLLLVLCTTILLINGKAVNYPLIRQGLGMGGVIGSVVVLWEFFWHQNKPGQFNFHPTILPNCILLGYPLCILLIPNNHFRAAAVGVLTGYCLLMAAGLFIFEGISSRRYRWVDLYPEKR